MTYKNVKNLRHRSWGSELVPDGPDDRRGQEPTADEKRAIEAEFGLERGCTLLMGGEKWYYLGVATFGQEAGEKPVLRAYRYTKGGGTADEESLLPCWRVEG